ncbi:Uncharacterized protein BP5553_09596 [Venustampulla echinocandica]|uniref:RING-type domain-containing protein n=1 Tax=Venustampulla echinocandica TaxID=2656787 RepID=A0A370TBH3_9HELO|nr:Uncharacterized protein BP5553_09596 [Venustampulla echinocandica]RDL31387.1 Uncharacterized protein BP5553_09596 [Venustampulla echinocandica]
MRPPRIIIAAVFFLATVFLTFLSLRSSHPPPTIETSSTSTSAPKPSVRSFFSVRTPFSLFPPNAIITLTHENSTAFLARPAAFGPLLPTEGLKGQLWIGSGFGDDSIRQGPVAAAAEGELGCSDVPGWVESYTKSAATAEDDGENVADGKSETPAISSTVHHRGIHEDQGFDKAKGPEDPYPHGDGKARRPSADDGTDDYLHHPFPNSKNSKVPDKQSPDSKGNHADIQSIQEGAEIAGKVVLLSRGGCGFLEKVNWAQRRGAIALIVGDDTKGGPLIQMYARGDTSHVTIPSIFTSRTTAHLLSSLIGPGSFLEDTLDEKGQPTLKVHHTDKTKKSGKIPGSRPTFTPTAAAATRPTATTRAGTKATRNTPIAVVPRQSSGFFKSLFFGSSKGNSEGDTSRPPSSGQLDWVLVDDWKDDDTSGSKKIPTKPAKPTKPKKTNSGKTSSQSNKHGTQPTSGDDFLIGIQDWRDPDLVGSSDSKDTEISGKAAATKPDPKSDVTNLKGESPRPTKVGGKKHTGGALQEIPEYMPPLRGGSITPGSGEYGAKSSPAENEDKAQEQPKETNGKTKGLLTTIFGDDEEDVGFLLPAVGQSAAIGDHESSEGFRADGGEYEGLWVTLTPTSGASPFLDTLLVLVVSPLVTLTVVYSLLLVRSRIRRRRWRAPKSVVERLPVRTYQTINPSGSQTPPFPTTGNPSVTTPLLQRSAPARPRPRSRTTTGIPEPGDLMRANSNPLQVPAIPPLTPEFEKHTGSESSQWRKYMGQQIECVVCLEEYVDGVSRVMSLPCGHEFHVDCITPWLTTRRRTCPICKGDVVRSLARGSPSSPRYEAYQDDSDGDIQIQAAERSNMSSSALPITGGIDDDDDVERGIISPAPTRPRVSDQAGSWRSLLASSLSSASRSPRQSQEDRNR